VLKSWWIIGNFEAVSIQMQMALKWLAYFQLLIAGVPEAFHGFLQFVKVSMTTF
jgi:hypothetical protein